MNSNVNNSIVVMEADELMTLVTEVKETVATNIRQFSAADLWNIQRNMKTAQRGSRRKEINA
ncbi:hypothetical protein I5907_11475 [Panacibacter sp. DH6]|uniref:Uncharacterized protein n=1 Tax=Panacibacter microcysteis TaxID=2793269 RepID=A0A931E3D3_9BACT|nr:hypothetical protein [Panacibacter microcysteis]MBG9376860.1 hypothetical protein [Panacibacter microcysteis]